MNDEDELSNDDGPTVMSDPSLEAVAQRFDDDTDSIGSGAQDDFGAEDRTVASPSFDEMERMRAGRGTSPDDIGFAPTAMGPSFDERLAARGEAPPPPASPPKAPANPSAPAAPPPPTSDPFAVAPAPTASPTRSQHARDDDADGVPKTMVLGPNDWGAPPGAPGGSPPGGGGPDPFAPAPAAGGFASAHHPGGFGAAPGAGGPAPFGSPAPGYGPTSSASHPAVSAPSPAGGKKNQGLVLFLVGLAVVMVFGAVAGGTLLLFLLMK